MSKVCEYGTEVGLVPVHCRAHYGPEISFMLVQRRIFNYVKCSGVTGSRFEWQLGENKVKNTPSPILRCISQLGENIGGRGY